MTRGVIRKAARRARDQRYRYGLQGGHYDRKLREQGGKCALASCLRPAEVVDHVHLTDGGMGRSAACSATPATSRSGSSGSRPSGSRKSVRYVRRGGG